MAKKAAAKKAAPVEMLLVGSKVKGAVRAQEMLCSGELLGALNAKVNCLIGCAVARAKANKRKTVGPQDV